MGLTAIDRANLKKLLAVLGREAKLYVPRSGENGAELTELSSAGDADFDFANLLLPPKRHFFPQSEIVYNYDANGAAEQQVTGEESVLFGVRPCDARSLVYLDKIFLDEKNPDPYYRARRKSTTVMALACTTPASSCFCTSVAGGPASAQGADIIVFDLDEAMLFESLTKKGEALVAQHAKLFREPTAAEMTKRNKQEQAAAKKMPVLGIDDVSTKLQENFNSKKWDDLSESCLSCGACTYLCPTCHCFDLRDERHGDSSARVRVHDACMFASFTSEASGHNPRPTRGARLRQRVMHKFSYTVENTGAIFCVGCGRCVAGCPRNIDIRETVSEMKA